VQDPITAEYIASLPEIDTARLPKGTLFWSEGRIYQVTETGTGGFHKAREWRKGEETDVALIRGSFPSRHLPLIARGRVLPVYRSRIDLTHDNRPTCYVFPVENLALDAAYLDVALVQSSGAYVRNQGNDPAFDVTDGVHVFRMYYYRRSMHNRPTNLSSLMKRPLPFTPQNYTQGPAYWRLLPSWTESTPSEITQPMRPVSPPPTLPEDTMSTQPNQPPHDS
jgi:hypothetical protein